uniref:Uncharacterized protein n=1 Tax=Caenorhabditis japonica TaxID=281687 RepID=A0A8R1IA55_CAEJA
MPLDENDGVILNNQTMIRISQKSKFSSEEIISLSVEVGGESEDGGGVPRTIAACRGRQDHSRPQEHRLPHCTSRIVQSFADQSAQPGNLLEGPRPLGRLYKAKISLI